MGDYDCGTPIVGTKFGDNPWVTPLGGHALGNPPCGTARVGPPL